MNRRTFIAALGSAAAWPPAARAQEAGRNYRLGFMIPTPREAEANVAFFDELRRSGFIEGQNLTVVPGGFGVRNDEVAERSAKLVTAAPDAIVCGGDVYARALQNATRTVPLICMGEDRVAEGLVASLPRPGGHTTGISMLSPELDGKRLDILIEAVPGARRVMALADSMITKPEHIQRLKQEARRQGVELSVLGVAKPDEIVPAINNAQKSGAQALDFLATPLFFVNRPIVIDRVTALGLPAMYQWPEMADEGGFAAYGPRINQLYRQRAQLVVKVLRGAKPADLPVEQPTKFELVINLKAAKAIGHEVPAGLVLRADKVIE